ncbi:phosphopantetheine-binding protein, partial [Streptomyces nogalater]
VGVLAERNVTAFVEIGPDGVLTALAQEALDDAPFVRPLLRRDQPECASVVRAVTDLHDLGVPVDWRAFFSGTGARRTDLPTYAFQHRRYWLDAGEDTADASTWGLSPTGHPFLGVAVPLARKDGAVFNGMLSPRRTPWPAGHLSGDTTVLPTAVLVELAVRAGDEFGCDVLRELTVTAPLTVPAESTVHLQVAVGAADGDGDRPVTVFARHADGPWEELAGGTLGTEPAPGTPATGTVSHEIELPEELREEAAAFELHPVLLDAAVGTPSDEPAPGHVTVAAEWRGVRLHAAGATAARVERTDAGDGSLALRLTDPAGELVATVDSVAFRDLPDTLFARAGSETGTAGGEPVKAPVRRRAGTRTEPVRSLAERLAGLSETQRYDLVSEVVRDTMAAVLGHTDPAAIDEERSFQELGFDSLTAVDLRNRLRHATGLGLAATAVFDHPTPGALTTHMLAQLAPPATPGTEDTTVALELDRLEAVLGSLPPESDDHAAVAERLQSLLSRLHIPGPQAVDRRPAEIETASADEIFDFIDNELGRTSG